MSEAFLHLVRPDCRCPTGRGRFGLDRVGFTAAFRGAAVCCVHPLFTLLRDATESVDRPACISAACRSALLECGDWPGTPKRLWVGQRLRSVVPTFRGPRRSPWLWVPALRGRVLRLCGCRARCCLTCAETFSRINCECSCCTAADAAFPPSR